MSVPNRSLSPLAPITGPTAAARTVLLADADGGHRRMMRSHLERAGYEVTEAGDGATALTLCRQREPDLILSDWMLPVLSGLDLCRAHRGLERQGYGYFILLAARSDSDDIAMGLRAGADDFLIKPIAEAELLARIIAAERVLDMRDSLDAANQELHQTLDALRATQDQMNNDLREARKLQQGLVRERQRRFGPMRVSLLMRPAGMIGGDLVGFHQLDTETVGLHAVDVSGHGVASALLTARLAAQIDALAQGRRLTPRQVVAALNDMMLDGPLSDSYLTMVYAQLHLPTGRVRLVQAGHPHPVVQRSDGTILQLGHGGLPVGVIAGARFDEIDVVLEPGDRMLIVSDGITDVVNRKGEMLGDEGLRTVLRLNAPLSGFSLLESMSWSVSEFSNGERADDSSALLLEHLVPASVIGGPGGGPRPGDADA